jgi:hypothetical protein
MAIHGAALLEAHPSDFKAWTSSQPRHRIRPDRDAYHRGDAPRSVHLPRVAARSSAAWGFRPPSGRTLTHAVRYADRNSELDCAGRARVLPGRRRRRRSRPPPSRCRGARCAGRARGCRRRGRGGAESPGRSSTLAGSQIRQDLLNYFGQLVPIADLPDLDEDLRARRVRFFLHAHRLPENNSFALESVGRDEIRHIRQILQAIEMQAD